MYIRFEYQIGLVFKDKDGRIYYTTWFDSEEDLEYNKENMKLYNNNNYLEKKWAIWAESDNGLKRLIADFTYGEKFKAEKLFNLLNKLLAAHKILTNAREEIGKDLALYESGSSPCSSIVANVLRDALSKMEDSDEN